jgi:Uma2 family endonuclease
MTTQLKQRVTLDEFEDFIQHPENLNQLFEFIGGEIVEVPSNPYASKIAGKIFGEIYIYLKTHDIGHLTGEAGGYMISGERYAPDVAYVSYERQSELVGQGYNPNPPELAVEVISDPSNAEEQRRLRFKLTSYLAAGVVVWVVNTQDRLIEVHQVGEVSQKFDTRDVLKVESILPGFELAVKDIFPSQGQTA